jgi:hypothetical protein
MLRSSWRATKRCFINCHDLGHVDGGRIAMFYEKPRPE